MGYNYGISLSLLIPFLIIVVSFFRKKSNSLNISFKPIYYLFSFVLIHEVILYVSLNNPERYIINNAISNLISFVAILIVTPKLNFSKLIGCISFVTIICLVGLLYHFVIYYTGGEVRPIKLPFFPSMGEESRLFATHNRPCSFFWEPQSYVSYTLIPLFYACFEKKYLWAVILVISMFLSTSTTGIIVSILLLIVFVITQDISRKQKIWSVVLTCGLLVFLFTSSLFESGVEKLETTDIETTSRLINGPAYVAAMGIWDCITGIPDSTPYEYIMHGGIHSNMLIFKHESVYLPSIWYMLIKFGIIGLLLFLNVYYQIVKQSKEIIPYVFALFISLFSNPDSLGGLFVYQIFFIYQFMNARKYITE